MKKNFQIIGVLALIWFSFFCTEKTAYVIKNTDDIMMKINEEKEKYETKYIDSIIVKDTIIPGKSGLVVNIEKSYKNMKRLGKYNPTLYEYDKQKPSISIYDNYNKYIVKGNPKKRNVYFIFKGSAVEIEKIYNILDSNSMSASYLLNDNSYGSTLQNIGKKADLVIDSDINYKNSKFNLYCYNKEKNNKFLEFCSSNNIFTIYPSLEIKNNFYLKIKQSLEPGLIVLIDVSDEVTHELYSVINYLKSKGYEGTDLTNLTKE